MGYPRLSRVGFPSPQNPPLEWRALPQARLERRSGSGSFSASALASCSTVKHTLLAGGELRLSSGEYPRGVRVVVELVMRLPGGAFWVIVIIAPLVGVALVALGTLLLVKTKKWIGFGMLGLGVASFAVSGLLLGCLFLDLLCTGRSGGWIC